MPAEFFARLGLGKDRQAGQAGLSRRLLRLVGRRGGITLDAAALADPKASPGQIRQAAYFLALQEYIHLLAERDGAIVLLSNSQFDQITRIRAILPNPALAPGKTGSGKPASRPAARPSEKGEGKLPAVPPPGPADGDSEYRWFTLEVAPPAGERQKNPPSRRDFPSRRREPWAVSTDAVPAREEKK
ncbi:MAG: hypothetical protein LBU64_03695 [Planctomycetota bacterium]|jgi:hypothetical protein|nr:hypothetical protein [Planctomycetota bacterium]